MFVSSKVWSAVSMSKENEAGIGQVTSWASVMEHVTFSLTFAKSTKSLFGLRLFSFLFHLLKPHSLAQVSEHFCTFFSRIVFRFGQHKAEGHMLYHRGHDALTYVLCLLAHRNADHVAELRHRVSLPKAHLQTYFEHHWGSRI